jgi:hypothetical protein
MGRSRTKDKLSERLRSWDCVAMDDYHYRIRSFPNGDKGWLVVLANGQPTRVVHLQFFPRRVVGGVNVPWTREEVLEMIRPNVALKNGTLNATPADPAFLSNYPSLWSFFSQETYEDGSRRELGSLRVLHDPKGGWSFMLKEPTAAACLFHTARSFDEGLQELEALLATGTADWKADKYAAKKPLAKGQK